MAATVYAVGQFEEAFRDAMADDASAGPAKAVGRLMAATVTGTSLA